DDLPPGALAGRGGGGAAGLRGPRAGGRRRVGGGRGGRLRAQLLPGGAFLLLRGRSRGRRGRLAPAGGGGARGVGGRRAPAGTGGGEGAAGGGGGGGGGGVGKGWVGAGGPVRGRGLGGAGATCQLRRWPDDGTPGAVGGGVAGPRSIVAGADAAIAAGLSCGI